MNNRPRLASRVLALRNTVRSADRHVHVMQAARLYWCRCAGAGALFLLCRPLRIFKAESSSTNLPFGRISESLRQVGKIQLRKFKAKRLSDGSRSSKVSYISLLDRES